MAISRKNNDAPKGVNLNRLDGLVKRIETKKSAADDARSDLGTIYKEAEDLGFNRAALKLAVKLRNMEETKRADFLSSLNAYCDYLGIWDQGNLFGDAEQGIGPRDQVISARDDGLKAGRAGANIDTNPHPAEDSEHEQWRDGWVEGQAQAVREHIKPTEMHGHA